MMKEEYCAGVRILIERMATNPEDFADPDYNYANMQKTRDTKFGHLAKMLDQLLTGRDKERLMQSWAEWHYLTKAEQDALLTAYKQMRRVEFDKRIMERVFDDKFYERQEEEAQAQLQYQQLLAQQRSQMLQPGSVLTTTGPNTVSPLQGGYVSGGGTGATSTAKQGLLGSLGSALGFTK